MTFLDARLDTRITRGAQVKVTNPGRIKVYVDGGDLTQVFTRSAPTHELDLAHGVRTTADFQVLIDSWYVLNFGPYTGLRVRVQSDYIATMLNSRATLITGSTTVVQLQRKHTFGGVTVLRDIYKPVSDTAVLYRTRAGSTASIAATVDYTTGLATMSGHAGGDAYLWSGEFDLPMTFVDNEWAGSLEVHVEDLHVSSAPIKLEELTRFGAVS